MYDVNTLDQLFVNYLSIPLYNLFEAHIVYEYDIINIFYFYVL